MIDLGTVKPGATIPVPFHTFDSNDPSASVTITGLAITDIEIYADGVITAGNERTSTNGYVLIDTDGIDLDGITGIHGFTLDLSDNSDAGFWAAGTRYTVIVASITVDAATINFIPVSFRIGYPGAFLDTVIETVTDTTNYVLAAGVAPPDNDVFNDCRAIVHDVATADQWAFVDIIDYVAASRTITLAAAAGFTVAATDNISFFPPALHATRQTVLDDWIDAGRLDVILDAILVDTAEIGVAGAGLTNINLPNQTMDIVGDITGNLSGSVGSLTGHTNQTADHTANISSILTDTAEIGAAGAGLTAINLPNQTMDIVGDITGNLSGSVGSVTGAVGSVAAGGISAASFAAAAIDAAALATDAVNEIRDAILSDSTAFAGANIDASIAANATPAEVLTQVNAALDTAIAELAQAQPTATPTLRTGMMLIYQALAQRFDTNTSGTDELAVYDSAGTKIAKKLITDAAGDYSEARMVSGP